MGRLCTADQFFQCGIFSAESEDGDEGVAVYGLSGVGGVFYAAAFCRFVYTGSALGILCPVHVAGGFNRLCRRQVFCCAAPVGCRGSDIFAAVFHRDYLCLMADYFAVDNSGLSAGTVCCASYCCCHGRYCCFGAL